MPSPFPGMNPFLEQDDTWEAFHHDFISHARAMLGAQVGPNYYVKVEVRLYLHELPETEHRYFARGDVGVIALLSRTPNPSAITRAAAPVQLTMSAVDAVDVEKHSSLEIRDRRHRRVVTVIKLLSPSNKTRGPDRDDYLHKRRQLLRSPTHFVEIDLRRGGERPGSPALLPCDYYALVGRSEDWPHLDMWPIGLRERLPTIPIPLTAPDPDVSLDLQGVLDRAYDAADYGKYIYDETPQPPLTEEELVWARQFLPPPAGTPDAS